MLIAVALAAVVVACLRLGWWQLQRYNSSSGSLQNLGYMLQWPTFAIFAVVMWWRLRGLERRRAAEQPDVTAEQPEVTPESEPTETPRTTTRPDGTEPDDELAAYNRYLAELNASAVRRKQH